MSSPAFINVSCALTNQQEAVIVRAKDASGAAHNAFLNKVQTIPVVYVPTTGTTQPGKDLPSLRKFRYVRLQVTTLIVSLFFFS